MTSEEILDGNKLIAEFLGINKKVYGETGTTYYIDGTPYQFFKLKYHSSWDWLMPVIGKLTSECEEPEELDNLRLHIITNDILYAWKFVVNYLSDKQ